MIQTSYIVEKIKTTRVSYLCSYMTSVRESQQHFPRCTGSVHFISCGFLTTLQLLHRSEEAEMNLAVLCGDYDHPHHQYNYFFYNTSLYPETW
jgi:hypothetical protein